MGTISIICGALVLILTAFAKGKWKKLTAIERITLIAVIFSAITAGIYSYQKHKKEQLLERINAKFGDIYDLVGATIPVIQVGVNGNKFILGSNGLFGFDESQPPLLKVYVKDNRLFVSGVIRRNKDEVLAALDENEWEMVDEKLDYNNDDTGFEVVTRGDRKVFFQVDLREGIAHITGFLVSSKGEGYYIYNRPIKSNPMEGSLMVVISPDRDFEFPIGGVKPLFKYPRGKHLSDRVLGGE